MTTSQTHNSQTCTLDNGGPCEMCRWAERHQLVEPVASTPDFPSDWSTAPRSMRNYVEHDVAQYWYLKGRQAEQSVMLVTLNMDLQEMARVAGARKDGYR